MSTEITSSAGTLMEMNSLTSISSQASSVHRNLNTRIASSADSTRSDDIGDEEDRAKETKQAREVAKKFESLLVHSLLKNMRKTTLAENTSNERAMYDDMLDKNLADTIVSSGGLGISDKIFEQINKGHSNSGTHPANSTLPEQVQLNRLRLRKLAMHLPADKNITNTTISSRSENTSNTTVADISQLQMVSNLWSTQSGHNKPGELLKHDFIETLLPEARIGAERLGTSPAAVLAIAALETGWGKSMIKDEQGNNSHNLFGIKASATDTRYAITRTTEYIKGSPQKIDDRFKMFSNDADAVKGFADFLTVNPRYKKALEHAGEPERFLRELQNAGYATDPDYADKAISIMRQIEQKPLPL